MPVTLDYYTSLYKKLSSRENLKKVYIFWGKEEYMMDMAVEWICKKALSAQRVIVDGSSKDLADEIASNLQGGLFQVEKVLVIKYVDKPERVLKFLELFLKAEGHFVIILRYWKPQPLPKKVEVIHFDSLDNESFKEWLKDKFKKLVERKISDQRLEYLAKRMPRDLRTTLKELEKLKLRTYGQVEIKNGDLDVLSDYEENIASEVLSSLLNSDSDALNKALKLLDDVEEPTYITSGFINYILSELESGSKKSRFQQGEEKWMKKRTLESEGKKSRFSKGDYLRMLLNIAKVDAQLKSLPVDKRLLLLELFESFKVNVG
jgi:DNA polymerase III delta subunit